MGDFNCTKYPTARKAHRCDECARVIQPGERYSRTAAIWEGDWFTNVACLHCAIARMIVDYGDDYYSEGYYHGLREWLADSAEHVWSLRLKVGVERCWQRFDGTGLMPLPANPWPNMASLAARLERVPA